MQKLVLSINYMSISPHVSFSAIHWKKKMIFAWLLHKQFMISRRSDKLTFIKDEESELYLKKCSANLLLLLLFVRFLHTCKVHRNLINNSSNKMSRNPSLLWPKVVFIKTQIWNITSSEYCKMC